MFRDHSDDSDRDEEGMFSDLYDYISLYFFWRWPKVDGVVTSVDLRRVPYRHQGADRLRLVVAYEFSVGEDGPYTGETAWSPLFGEVESMNVSDRLRTGQTVAVRYRRDDPSVNKLDRSVWQDFQSL
jgi:hypothetical protein